MFGIKDLFTTVNLLGGAFAIFLCADGKPFAAGVAIIVGYLLGDALDGPVARKLGTSNAFGAEYDTISDHLAHTIAPAVVVYAVYAQSSLLASPNANKILGAILGGAIMIASSVRHARNIVQPVSVKGIWSGLPRTVLGFVVIGFCLSATVDHYPAVLWGGLVVTPAACIATLTRLPFPNHHISRKHYGWVRVLIGATFVALIGALLFYPRVLFDILFVTMGGYSLVSFVALTEQERSDYRGVVKRAQQEYAA